MPRIVVIGIIAFGALIYFIGSGSNDWDPNRMSATEYIGAIAFLGIVVLGLFININEHR